MKVLPRSKWTGEIATPRAYADNISGQEIFRHPVGISLHGHGFKQTFQDDDPVAIWNGLLTEARTIGHSDIDYNLGVGGSSVGVWCLRGLQNKGSASPDIEFNNSHVSIYVLFGTEEVPTDALLDNILNARRLVLSKYPSAKQVDFRGLKNERFEWIFTKGEFWNRPPHSPVGEVVLPTTTLTVGMAGVFVQELQEQLAYLGYYRKRVDGIFNIQTEDAVRELQENLRDGGYFYFGSDGIYNDHLRVALTKWLNS